MPRSTFRPYAKYSPEVRRHFEDTPIEGSDSYVGKEHFWRLLIDAGFNQNIASRVYQTAAFPSLQHENQGRAYPANPAGLGIVVTSRQAVGMPTPPSEIIDMLDGTESPDVVHRNQSAFGHSQDSIERVVQTGSFVIFASRLLGDGFIQLGNTCPRLVGLGPSGVQAANAMAERLTRN